MTPGRTNYRLRDGDLVELTAPVRIDGYWLPNPHGRGSWDAGHMLPGVVGKVVKARTPCVFRRTEQDPAYFANVDVDVPGHGIIRIRPFHHEVRRVSCPKSSTPVPTTR